MTDKSQRKRELIQQVLERVDAAAGEPAGPSTAFVEELYANVPPADLTREEAEDLHAAAAALWDLGRRRSPGEALVRVYNPDAEEHGWSCPHTVIEIVNDDMPFLVDSVAGELQRQEAQVLLIVHPILTVRRNDDGRLREVAGAEGAACGDALRESFMQIRVGEEPAERHEPIRRALLRVLEDVRAAVEDWQPMQERCRELIRELEEQRPPVPEEEIAETVAFLKWMEEGYFTFLGYREVDFQGGGAEAVARVRPDRGLGLLRDAETTVFDGMRNLGRLLPEIRAFVKSPGLLRITKAHRRSTVHRTVSLDTVAVKDYDPASGQVTGERLFVGLFTSEAYSRSARHIPVLRRKIANILERSGLPEESHDRKALVHILESYPRDELFQAGEEELEEIATGILHLQGRQQTALFTRRDPFERFVSCLVYVPRDRYDTALRKQFESILAGAHKGEAVAYYTHLTESPLARLLFIIRITPGVQPDLTDEEIEAALAAAARAWEDRLREALVEELGEARGLRLLRRYGGSFPTGYQARYGEAMAVLDVVKMEEAVASGGLATALHRPVDARPEEVRFRTYLPGDRMRLSDVLPMLENMGLQVIDEHPFEIRPAGMDRPVWIRDVSLVSEDASPVDLEALAGPFQEAFARVWRGEMQDDGFNKLVLFAGLAPREVMVLRAYARYLRQARTPFGQSYMQATLRRHPEVARLLVRLFLVLFDPAGREEAEEEAGRVEAEIRERLELVTNLDEDRILRRFLNAVTSTLRTSYFRSDGEGRHRDYLSFKLDSQALHDLPLPRPYREIYVFSPRMEGIHLRGGRVARGGIRWSDRREDFRTEVLGLMKAQMVKNAVIVPVGSKGGFVVSRPPAEREALQAEVAECYRTLIRGMLDLTDDLRGDEVVPPLEVVRRDDDDTYLVVAADKGTATFSDLANAISAEYGFWLDDAFASGGSAGYDHKKMGITARGAWESVKRHFRELGRDIQSQDFTVVGVGDMSGDVFGNGMLLSRHIRLLGAFNHLHVFVDPDPDPEASWEERKRLFELPRSSWADYDPDLISESGGVFERRAKAVPVSDAMRRRFGLEGEQVTPGDLIRALLRAEVDLLWFGGIGTYVKASEESHQDVDDRTNDPLRVDAREVRALVVGEGANLAVTQRGRVELGKLGCRLNTDAIDNSAGVDCSDHEVNIKILLGGAEESGELDRPRRNELLGEMTDEVAALVLRDNYLQTQAISVTHHLGAGVAERIARFMRALERRGRLDRRLEALPDDEEVAERVAQGTGFTRPELAVLLAYAKIDLHADLLASELPDDPFMAEDLTLYFPHPLRRRFGDAIARHRLRREIVATMVTNGLVNRVGLTFVHEVQERTGEPAAQIARAYVVSREVFRLRELWHRIESLATGCQRASRPSCCWSAAAC